MTARKSIHRFIPSLRRQKTPSRAVLFCVLALCLAFPGFARAEKSDLLPVAEGGSLIPITLGKAELIEIDGNVADVMVANPAVIDVSAIQSNRLYVVGLSVGDTNLIAVDAEGNVLEKLDVHVKYDLKAIQALVEDLFPDEKVKVGAVHDQILLTGTVSTPQVAGKISNVVGHYVSDLQDEKGTTDELISNLLEVRGEQQVMLQVKIVEASRNVLKELGVETSANDPDELSATTIFGTTPPSARTNHGNAARLATGAGIGLSQDAAGTLGLLLDSGLNGVGTLGIVLNALEEENLVNILAEPNLTSISGEQAGFLAGGEFPVPVGRDQTGNIVIEFREFGVSLNFKPVVLSDKRISLQLNTEVSSLDFDNAIVLADLTVPGLDVRRAETTVEIPSGGSLMIAGLLQSDAIKGMAGLPGVRKAPVLGKLVSSDSFQRNETELVVFVTPYLVEPYAETKRAEKPAPQSTTRYAALSTAYESNIKRTFKVEDRKDLFAGAGSFGYMLE